MLQQRLVLSALAICRLVRCFVAYTHVGYGSAAVIQLVFGSDRPEYTWSPVVICIHLDSEKAVLWEQTLAGFRLVD